jgi:type I restriction enzyme S subunit
VAEAWNDVPLSEIGQIITGSTPPAGSADAWGEDAPFLTPSDITDGATRYVEAARHLSPVGASRMKSRMLPAGAVCFVSIGSTIGKVCMTRRPSLTNQQINSVIVDQERFDPVFVYFCLRQQAPRIAGIASGSATPIINKAVFGVQRLAVPSLPTQRGIAEVLGALDDKIENCATVAASADALFHAEWERRFGYLQLTPNCRLSDVCSTQYGYTASATSDPIGPRFLRVTDINKTNWIDWNNVPYCAVDDSTRERYGLKRGDLVVARMADPGKASLIEPEVDAVFASYLVRLVAHRPQGARFLFGFLKSRYYKEYAASHTTGSVQKNMNAKVIVGAPLAVPSADKVTDFDAWARPIRDVVTAALAESAAATRIRDALLPPLLSGELGVRDAEELVGEAL